MTHREIDPGLDCPGYLRADRFRHEPDAPTHAWFCSVCCERFTRYPGAMSYTVGHAVTPQRQAELIRAALTSAPVESISPDV